MFGHRPQQCDIPPANATLDKYQFMDDEPPAQTKEGENEVDGEEEEPVEKLPL